MSHYPALGRKRRLDCRCSSTKPRPFLPVAMKTWILQFKKQFGNAPAEIPQ